MISIIAIIEFYFFITWFFPHWTVDQFVCMYVVVCVCMYSRQEQRRTTPGYIETIALLSIKFHHAGNTDLSSKYAT